MPIESPYKLVVAAKDGTVVRTVDLAHRRALSIGRSPRCDLTIDIDSISRRHATLIFLEGLWTMVDCGSKSKFKVDNEKVDHAVLSEDRPIHLGGAYFWLQAAPASPVRPTPQASSATEELWSPPASPTTGASLTIMDLEARPLHQISLEGEVRTLGTSPLADCPVDLDGWGSIQLAVVHEQSGPALLDVGQENLLRHQAVACRRWAGHQRTILRCAGCLLEWEAEQPNTDTQTGLWESIQDDSLG
ncbi:MAG: hypothetical protein CMJ30_06025 [Phycisphaerae bacterium]|jgi:predicted component of type VI protein secretion system|nr:hypothetical protein [Phycisphaerae bacterium]